MMRKPQPIRLARLRHLLAGLVLMVLSAGLMLMLPTLTLLLLLPLWMLGAALFISAYDWPENVIRNEFWGGGL